MNFYLAGSWSRRAELKQYADVLDGMGHPVTSSWLHHVDYDKHDDGTTITLDWETKRDLALQDLSDIEDASVFVAFTEPPGSSLSRGGRHVEYGYAYLHGCSLWVVGPEENIFHTLASNSFENFDALLSHLRKGLT